jgi:DNA primase large subunit
VSALRSLKQKLGQSVQDLEREMERLEDNVIYILLERQKFMDFYHAFRTDIALGMRSELKDYFARAEIVIAAQRVKGYLVTRPKIGEKYKKESEP